MGRQPIYICFVLFVVFITGCGQARQNDEPVQLAVEEAPLKSGIVVFRPVRMLGVLVSNTLYFDDYGQKQMVETISEGNVFGLSSKNHSVSLLADGYMYSFDLYREENGRNVTENLIVKTKLTAALLADYPLFLLSDSMTRFIDYREEGSELLVGVKGTKFSYCLYSEYPQRRIHGVQYNSVILRAEIKGVEVVAQTFFRNPDIPSQRFDLPSNYKIQEYDSGEIDAISPTGGEDVEG